MIKSGTAAEHGVGLPVIHLSELLRAPVQAGSGEAVGRVEDVIVRLRGVDEYPLVTGIVAGSAGGVSLSAANRLTSLLPGPGCVGQEQG